MFLLGPLPLWGREGVTLIAFFKRMKSERISTKPKFPKISGIERYQSLWCPFTNPAGVFWHPDFKPCPDPGFPALNY